MNGGTASKETEIDKAEVSASNQQRILTRRINSPSIETHPAAARGLPTKKFQTECVNKKISTERRSQSRQTLSRMSGTDSSLIRQD